jgi:hypothetical protein
MTPETKYERIGKFIYAAGRHGGDIADVYNWMADALSLPHPADEAAQASTLDAYLARYASEEQFNENFQNFLASAERRARTE